MDFSRALQTLQEECTRTGAPLAVVGGLALQAYGAARATVDLDVLTTREGQAAMIGFLESLGYRTLHRSAGYSNHEHADHDLGRIDVVYVERETADKLFAQALRVELFPGVWALVPSVQHLIAMKVHAIKNEPKRRLQDLADIQRLVLAIDLEPESVRPIFVERGLLDAYEELRRAL